MGLAPLGVTLHIHAIDVSLFARGPRHPLSAHHRGAGQAKANSEVATSADLKKALETGLRQNLDQAERLERAFHAADLAPHRAMRGIIDDNQDANAQAGSPLALDLTLIDSGQLAAHYDIAHHGTLRSHALTMGNLGRPTARPWFTPPSAKARAAPTCSPSTRRAAPSGG